MARTRQEIKDALSNLIHRILTEGAVVEVEGVPVQVTPSAQHLQAAIAFLKIDEDQAGVPVPKNTSGLLREFEKKLPFGPKAVQ
jgi:hypothetical protein